MKKLLLTPFLILIGAINAHAQTPYIVDPPAPGATLTVCAFPAAGFPCSNPATIYNDSALTSPVTQPLQLSSGGQALFYVTVGSNYVIQLSGTTTRQYIIYGGSSAGSSGISGLTTGQLGVAGSATTLTSSIAIPSGFAFSDCTSSCQTQLNGKQASLGYTAANVALSNLASPALNAAPSPGTDNAISLDDLTHRFINVWMSGVVGWTNGAGAADTGLSRDAAATVDVGNGTAGNKSGTLNLATLNATSSINTGATPPTACGSATGCIALGEASTAGTPAAGADYIRADSTAHQIKYSFNGGSEANLPVTAAQITTLIQGLTGCNTAAFVYTPQASDCVAQSGGATTALDNLASVNINTSLLAQTGVDLGSTAKPFRNVFLWGNGTFGSTYIELTGTPTGTRVWTFQDTTDVVVGRGTTDTLTNKSIALSELNSGLTSGGVFCATSTTVPAFSVALTVNVLPKGGGAGACPTNSSITDNGAIITSPEAIELGSSPPTNTAGTSGGSIFGEGTAFTGVANTEGLYGDSTLHCVDLINQTVNNGCAVGEAAIIAANVIPKAIGTTPGATTSLLSDNGSTLTYTGATGVALTPPITTYANIATVSNGVPAEYATIDLTGQTAAKTATALYTPTATGLFRACYYAKVTTAATTSSILGGTTGLVLVYTDGTDSVSQTAFTLPSTSQAGNTVTIGTGNTTNTTQATVNGCGVFYAKTGVGITYAFGYTSVGGTPMAYELHVKLEAQ